METPPVKAAFEDKAQGKVYEIFYESKKALLRSNRGTRGGPALDVNRLMKYAVGTQVINGIKCTGFSILNGTDGGKVIGTAWRSLDYDIFVKMESQVLRNGSTLKEVRELYDIQLGVEPASGSTGIPSGFAVSDTISLVPLTPRRAGQ